MYSYPNEPTEWPNVRALHQGKSQKIDILAGGYLVMFGQHANGDVVYIDFLESLRDAPE